MSHGKPRVHDNRFTSKCHPVHSVSKLLVTRLIDMTKLGSPTDRDSEHASGRPQTARGTTKLKELGETFRI